MAGRSVTFTTHQATIWDSSPAELCHATPSASPPVRSILMRGGHNFPASRTKMSNDHVWRQWAEPKHLLSQCFWCHTIICRGFKILTPVGAFLALEERLQKGHPVFVYMPDQAIANNNLKTTSYCNTCLYTMNRVKEKFMAESL